LKIFNFRIIDELVRVPLSVGNVRRVINLLGDLKVLRGLRKLNIKSAYWRDFPYFKHNIEDK
jgi:hypothetical protein